MAGCGADELANQLIDSLVEGADFTIEIPDFTDNLYQVPQPGTDGIFAPITRITNEDLTTKVIGGTGTFDFLMDAFKVHLKNEQEQNRISGAEYTKAYIALSAGAMANATQFLMGKDLAYWQAANAQLTAQAAQVGLVTARILMESEKTRLITLKLDALNRKAEYAMTKMRLSTESIEYCTRKYNLEEMLPQQKNLLIKQLEQTDAEIENIETRTEGQEKQNILLDDEHALATLKSDMLTAQIANQEVETIGRTKQNLLLDAEYALAPFKQEMLEKQIAHQDIETISLTKRNILLDDEHLMAGLKSDMLTKQITHQEAETTGQLAQNQLLEDQHDQAELNMEILTNEAALSLKRIDALDKQNILLDDEHNLAASKADMLLKQITGVQNQNSKTLKEIDVLQNEIELGPKKIELLTAQVAYQEAQSELAAKQVELAEGELELVPFKKTLMEEQAESQRAQTLDIRTDGTPVTGTLGKQRELYAQQVISYKRDAEMKAAKIFTDAWITMKTLDEGLAPPAGFANSNLDSILTTLKTVNNL